MDKRVVSDYRMNLCYGTLVTFFANTITGKVQ
jgi:hypothetical protein